MDSFVLYRSTAPPADDNPVSDIEPAWSDEASRCGPAVGLGGKIGAIGTSSSGLGLMCEGRADFSGWMTKKGVKCVEYSMVLSQGTAYVLAGLKGGESPPLCFSSAEVDEIRSIGNISAGIDKRL